MFLTSQAVPRAILTVLATLAAPVQADVYSMTDANGVTHYTNAPANAPGGSQYRLIVGVLEQVGADNRAQARPLKGNVATYAPYIEAAATEAGIESALVHAVITAESGYNPVAVSKAGAQGLMQLMPQTAERYAVKNAFDPAQNIRGGTRYLRELLDLFGNDVALAVAAYNAGENAVIRHGRQIPPYRETQAYVPKVLRLFEKYRKVL